MFGECGILVRIEEMWVRVDVMSAGLLKVGSWMSEEEVVAMIDCEGENLHGSSFEGCEYVPRQCNPGMGEL